MSLSFPHLDYIEKHKIDVANSDAPANLKRAVTKFNTSFDKFQKVEDEQLKTQWQEQLEQKSKDLLSDLQEEFPDGKHKDQKKEDEKKEDEKKAEKKEDEKKEDEKKAEKKEDEKKEDEKKAEKKEDEKEEISNEQVLDKLWKSKAVNGKLEITEDELGEAGFNVWDLGYFSDQIGPYTMNSAFGSETWTVVKEKKTAKKEESTA